MTFSENLYVSQHTSTGTLNYQSSAAADGGLYQVVALVEQDGLPRDEIVLGSYQIAPATKAAPPTSVVATATADGASISWQPPTSDGGRRITGYRLSTSKGFPVWFDAHARSGELPIPSMNPGDSVDVYVQAITSAGPGQDGVGSFVATGTTGPVYEQTFRDLQLPNPSSVARPESIPTATADDIPTNISPPDAPGSVVQPPVVTTPTGPTVPVPNPLPNLPTTGGNSMWPAMLAVPNSTVRVWGGGAPRGAACACA